MTTALPEDFSSPVALQRSPLTPVGRATLVNRETLCPVCLKACDISTQDIVAYWPAYLPPWDTLRAYDGAYHRACLYQLGDYPRLVEAWHRGEQAALKASGGRAVGQAPIQGLGLDPEAHRWPQVVAFERDLLCLQRSPDQPVELLLFPRFVRWEFRTLLELQHFAAILQRCANAPDRRQGSWTIGALTLTAVANHPLCTLRWAIPLELVVTLVDSGARPASWWQSRRGIPTLGRGSIIDLALAPVQVRSVDGGQLETEVDWDLTRISGRLLRARRGDTPQTIRISTRRLRFVPLWDDEVDQLVRFCERERVALQRLLKPKAGPKR